MPLPVNHPASKRCRAITRQLGIVLREIVDFRHDGIKIKCLYFTATEPHYHFVKAYGTTQDLQELARSQPDV